MDIIITLVLVVAFLMRPQVATEGFLTGLKEGLKKK